MIDWIETERTRMRLFEEADAEEAFTWFSDPEVKLGFQPSHSEEVLGMEMLIYLRQRS